jgi:hypothetical protein
MAFFLAVLASLLVNNPVESLAGTSLIAVGAVFYGWMRRQAG